MQIRQLQQGSVLIISLMILLVMTVLGVGAMTDSGLQERMVANQKQMIQGMMAAEAGAIAAMQWLNDHPRAWVDDETWQAAGTSLASEPPKVANFGDNSAYWIDTIAFAEHQVTIISRGGVFIGNRLSGQSTVTVVLQAEDIEKTLPEDSKLLPRIETHAGLQEARGSRQFDNEFRHRKAKSKPMKVLIWRQTAIYER